MLKSGENKVHVQEIGFPVPFGSCIDSLKESLGSRLHSLLYQAYDRVHAPASATACKWKHSRSRSHT